MLERTLDSVPGVDNQEIYESTGIVITKDASFEVEEPKRGFEDEPGPKLPYTKETSNEVYRELFLFEKILFSMTGKR